MIAYKVVEKGTRHCSNWTLLKNAWKMRDGNLPLLYRKFKREFPEYFPRYLKGHKIKQARGSVGVLCFRNVHYARNFKSHYKGLKGNKTIIIKVEGTGMKKERFKLTSGCGSDPDRLGTNKVVDFYRESMRPPSGTVAFKSVIVLE